MKKCISASSALLVTAMMVTLSFGCGEGIEGDTGSQSAQLRQGECNAIVAKSLRVAQKCFRSGCEEGSAECLEAGAVLSEFFGNQECAAAAVADELNGLPSGNPATMPEGSSRPGELKHIGVVICSAISDCGACPGLPEGFCPGICP